MSFRKGDNEQGIAQFKKLFEKKRGKNFFLNLKLKLKFNIFQKFLDHYDALSTLIRFLYRAGKIDDAKSFFEKIEKEIPKSVTEPGYNYAYGLFYQ